MSSWAIAFGFSAGIFGAMGSAAAAYACMKEERETAAKVMGGLALVGAFAAGASVQSMFEQSKKSAPAPVEQKSGESPSKPQDIPVPVKKSTAFTPAA